MTNMKATCWFERTHLRTYVKKKQKKTLGIEDVSRAVLLWIQNETEQVCTAS